MKKLYLALIFLCALHFSATAETWNGGTSSDWNTAANWTPATVPNATSVVSIPTFGITNYPQLTSNITIERISMLPGAKLDVNGFVVNILGGTGINNFNTDTINNSAPGTNIVFNIASNAGYSTRISQSVFTDTITFNITGAGAFYEGYTSTPNTFHHAVTYNINSALDFFGSYISPTNYLEDVTVNRTAVGYSNVLGDGANIAGNFSFTNNVGGDTRIGGAGANQLTVINGTINITVVDTTTDLFLMNRIKNLTTGGTISVQGSRAFTVDNDTLLVNNISLTNYSGSRYAYLTSCDITGNLTISPDSTYAGGYHTQLKGNVITGTTTISNPCSNALYEAFGAGSANTFNGNTTVNANGSGIVQMSYSDASTYNGNLTVNRTVAGNTFIFPASGTVNGDFNYANTASGNTDIGNFSATTNISGTVNITMPLTAPGTFKLYSIKNQTGGGSIVTNNTLGAEVRKDTLILNDLTLADYTGNAYVYIWDNQITGNVTLSTDSNYTGGYSTDLRRNIINGNTQITINSGNALNEANTINAGNIFNGNATFIANGFGTMSMGYQDTSSYNGNLTIIRNVAGTTTALGSGGLVTGNFSYTNNVGGPTNFGFANYPTLINGTINMQVNYPTSDLFNVLDFTNLTTGGIIDVRGTRGFNFRNDSLKVASMSLTEYTGLAYARFFENQIVGDLTISDDTTYAGGYTTDIQDNTITGNTIFNHNSTNSFDEAYNGTNGNVFNGNTIYNVNGSGRFRMSAFRTSIFNGNVTVNRSQDGISHLFEGGGIVNGNMALNNTATCSVYFGSNGDSTLISGTLDISINDTTPQPFNLRWVVNQTTGGVINIQGTEGANIYYDTLKVASFTLSGYKGNAYTYLFQNQIEGDVTIESDSAYIGGWSTSMGENKFIGNTSLTNNSTNTFYDAHSSIGGSQYLGNLSITKGQGPILFAQLDTTTVSGNLTLNSSSGISLGYIKFVGDSTSSITQLGTQDVVFYDLIMDKPNAELTLNHKVRIDHALQFINGKIICDSATKLTFKDNASTSGASDSSHVEGIISKVGNDAFTFPIGKNGKYAPLAISAPAISTDEFTAEYFEATPHTSGYDSSMKDASIHHISHNEYWICDRMAGTSDVNVTLSWNAAARSGTVNNLGDLLVCRWDGTTWKDEGQTAATGSFSSGTITSNTITSFSPFTLGSSTANNPLPLSLVSFEAFKEDEQSRLNWITENEDGVQEFVVERSADGLNFEVVNSVIAQGNSLGKISYESFDTKPLQARNYYRLKMLDLDGNFSYSETRVLDFSSELPMTLYPNPVKDVLYINTDVEISAVEIYDVSGKLISRSEDGDLNEIDLTSLTKGVYFIKLFSVEQVTKAFKFLKE